MNAMTRTKKLAWPRTVWTSVRRMKSMPIQAESEHRKSVLRLRFVRAGRTQPRGNTELCSTAWAAFCQALRGGSAGVLSAPLPLLSGSF